MATPTCDVCNSPLQEIASEITPGYILEINLADELPNLPDHLKHMKLLGLSQVVRCPACGLEDENPPIEMFHHLAYIKMFQTFPCGVALRIMRDFFGYSRIWLARMIGYDSLQTIYRYENSKSPIPLYAKRAIISAFLHIVEITNSGKRWYFDSEDWYREDVELTEDMKIIVPLPIQLVLIPQNSAHRKMAKVKFNAI